MTQKDKEQECKKCGRVFGSVKCFDVDCPNNIPKTNMNKEDKDLLLKDIYARIPYGVKGIVEGGDVVTTPLKWYAEHSLELSIKYMVVKNGWKPYLFPMSSMTAEQQEEFDKIYADDMRVVADNLKNRLDGQPYEMNLGHYRHIDWLDKNHFDYRGLIPKGLAIDATGLNVY